MLTMGQVIQLARLGESDATFMALLSGALLVWYSGRERGWSPYLYQSLAYLLLTAATLTKGPQAPVYFAGAVGLYLIYHKKWRELFHPAHFVGIAIYLGLISFWHYLFILQYSLKDLYVAYFGEVEKRMTDFTWLQYMGHLILYPLEIMAACLAPWSILFCAQCNRQFRQFFQSQHYSVSFMLIAIGVAWPTVWLPAASNTRYFLPLLPCVAILLGYHIETLLKGWTESQLTGASVLRQIWLRFSWTMLAMMVVSGLGLTVISFFPSKSLPAENGAVLALLALVTLLLVFVTLSIREGKFQQRAAYLPVQVSLMVLFIAVIVNGPVTSFMSFRSNNAVPHIAAVRAMIPTTETLISFDLTHHLFTYFWKDDLPRMPWPETKAHIPAGQKYFCFLNSGSRPYPPIPCAWQEIATVNCDRNLKNVAYDVVVVGKFLMPSEVEAIQAQADASIIATLHLPVEEIATSSIPPTKTPVGRNEPAGILK
jgi:4-amino-4-deoxy-L-arabinose transferase-like glycosyltransferase